MLYVGLTTKNDRIFEPPPERGYYRIPLGDGMMRSFPESKLSWGHIYKAFITDSPSGDVNPHLVQFLEIEQPRFIDACTILTVNIGPVPMREIDRLFGSYTCDKSDEEIFDFITG